MHTPVALPPLPLLAGSGGGDCRECGHAREGIACSPLETWLRGVLRVRPRGPRCATAVRDYDGVGDALSCPCAALIHATTIVGRVSIDDDI